MHPTLRAALCGLTLVAGTLCAQTLHPVALTGAEQASYRQALEAFRGQRYAGAYARFARLADAGHVPSAQIALLMVQQGPALFGSDWAASPGQQRRWNALTINAARQRLDFVDNERGD